MKKKIDLSTLKFRVRDSTLSLKKPIIFWVF